MPGPSKVPTWPGGPGRVVARLTTPFISIRPKNPPEYWLKSKACMTNQYLPVSNSQMTIDVMKTIRMLAGERSDSRPCQKLSSIGVSLSRSTPGSRGITQR